MRRLALLGVLLAALLAAPAFAVQPDEVLPDPTLEQRARVLSKQVRCMVCQNQSIDDSDAPLARDLRLLIRDRLKAGDSDSQVLSFLVSRYGEFVLLNPRVGWHTAFLWSAPAVVLVIGAIVVIVTLRRRPVAATVAATLAPEEEARIEALLRAAEARSDKPANLTKL